MEWTESLKKSISYIEANLLEEISADDVADQVHMSSFYLQKGFKIMTGYTIAEYIRSRRLYLAALDLIAGRQKVIELAYKYGYDTPESFTKAFSRFHGVSPMQMQGNAMKVKTFLPLKISILIQGGNDMDYTVEKMKQFQVIGFEREFSMEDSYEKIPKFWDEFAEKYLQKLFAGNEPETDIEHAICDCKIGEYGVCVDLCKDGRFRYLIAGIYHGGKVPEGMSLFEFPETEWVKFRCVGSMPGAMQSVNTKIFKEWLPGNTEFKISMGANIEWYSLGDNTLPDYESGIWLPVERI